MRWVVALVLIVLAMPVRAQVDPHCVTETFDNECQGGANDGNTCAAASVCPGGLCRAIESVPVDTIHFSAPWSAFLAIDGGTAVVTVKGWSPCLDHAVPCTRAGGDVLATLNSGNLVDGGVGPLGAVSFNPSTCTGCDARVTFCGMSPSGHP